jgi:hypothetical protein
MADGKHIYLGDKTRKYDKGSSDLSIMEKLFKGGPLVGVTYAAIVDMAKKALASPITGNPDFSTGYSLNFPGSPDLAKEVKTGPGGLPSSAFTPPLTSVGIPGDTKPSDLPETPKEAITALGRDGLVGTDSLASPKDKSAEIVSGVELGKSMTFGKHK